MRSVASLLAPTLMPSRPERRFAARALARPASRPPLLNPIRLMTARSATSRNSRGLGLPVWGRGVSVPISTAPKPIANSPSTATPSLSRPAATPSGLANRRVPIWVASRGFGV
ncbi:hypothetical protein WR25_07179 [Diploscapter pachys]|uniref:Uncharacterized protein n=1 Tax=Diploscapter pachys TaxID=2018661 RepID=A0A2A2M4U8_9BILA|nr:hypothetical protein WR25_07179 [Diploscapter pachys]